MARTSLPPGFRFHPTDIELVMYYLKRKVMGKKFLIDAISELNIYKFSPWDLPDKSCLRSKDLEWYFFCPRERKYASGARANRATGNGYWKTTGKDRPVLYNKKTVGVVRTLVFHIGHAPRGERTDWVMYEYKIGDKDLADAGVVQDAYVLCKVFQKSGPGPKNGAQYGAPFNEEEWDDDVEICAESLPHDGLSPAALVLPNHQNSSVVTSMIIPGSTCSWPLCEPGPSTAMPSANEVPQAVPDDDIFSLLDMFTEDSTVLPTENDNNEKLGNCSNDSNIEAVSCSDGNDIYNGLGELGNCSGLSEGGFNFSGIQEAGYALNPMLLDDHAAFLELNDLDSPLNFPTETSRSERLPIDNFCAPYNCYGNLEQFYHGSNFLSAVNVSDLSLSPVLAEGSNGQDHFDVLQKDNGIGDGANQEYNVSLRNVDFTSYRQPEGSRDTVQNQERGEQQRKPYSRLQQLLESIPARPASAVELLAPLKRAERSNESFSPYGCSSIYVKAEVSRRSGGCTKDALSVKLGESTCVWSCGCNLPRADLWQKVANCGSGFAFVFYLGMISALMWFFMVVLFTKLGRYGWNSVLS